MEHELSAIYDVAHGAGLAVLTPNWMEYVFKENIPMFTQFAVNVMGVNGSYREPEAVIWEGIIRLREFFCKMGLPTALSDIGIGEEKLELMAKKATGVEYMQTERPMGSDLDTYSMEHGLEYGQIERPLGGLKKLYWQDVLAIYKQAK
jgi:alcohol dehydrogenase YqhD (iron-dependent ADH family)